MHQRPDHQTQLVHGLLLNQLLAAHRLPLVVSVISHQHLGQRVQFSFLKALQRFLVNLGTPDQIVQAYLSLLTWSNSILLCLFYLIQIDICCIELIHHLHPWPKRDQQHDRSDLPPSYRPDSTE